MQTSGAMRRENADAHSVVIVREGGRSSIPEAAVIEPISRGVLDTRLRGYDAVVWRSIALAMTASQLGTTRNTPLLLMNGNCACDSRL